VKIRKKMAIGFMSVALVMVIGEALSMFGVHRIMESFEGGEEHFRAIVATAVQVADDAKAVEHHLMTYLMLGRRQDRQRFLQLKESLVNGTSALEQKIRDPGAKRICALIKADIALIETTSTDLLGIYDPLVAEDGIFDSPKHRGVITKFTDATAAAREHSIKLAKYQTDFLNRQEAITAATNVCNYARRLEGHLVRYLVLGDQTDRKKVKDRADSLHQILEVLDERVENQAGRDFLTRIKREMDRLLASAKTLLESYDNDVSSSGAFQPADHRLALDEMHEQVHRIVRDGAALAKLNVDLETQVKARAQANARFVQQGLVLSFTVASVLALVLAYFISKRLSDPIHKLEAAAGRIANGDLDARVQVASQDEIGTLARAFNGMAESLASSRQRLIADSEELQRRSRELARVNDLLKEELALRNRAEQEVAAAKGRLEFLLRSSPVVLYTCALTGDNVVTFISENAGDIMGYQPRQFLESPTFRFEHVHPDDRLAVESSFSAAMASGRYAAEYRFRLKDGTHRWIREDGRLITDDRGIPLEILSCCYDVTDRRIAENKLKESLHEKEILLSEIHHRVKNNLQIMSSLLTVQRQYLRDEKLAAVLSDAENRILSMAMVHENLYRSGNLARISLREYVQRLTTGLLECYTDPTVQVALDVDVEDVFLDI